MGAEVEVVNAVIEIFNTLKLPCLRLSFRRFYLLRSPRHTLSLLHLHHYQNEDRVVEAELVGTNVY